MPDDAAEARRRASARSLRDEAEGSVTEIFDAIFNQLPIGLDARFSPTLDTEFVYYSTTLRTLAPTVSSTADRKAARRWIRKLYGPEYHCDMFKEKRNRYVLALSITLLDDEVSGIFAKPPPSGALVEVTNWTKPAVPAPAWESDTMWTETLDSLPDHIFSFRCSVHRDGTRCPEGSPMMHAFVDDEFKLLLYLARPYAAMLPSNADKNVVANWLQALCAVKKNACPQMKGIRNDYMKALLGYVSELRVAGPFVDYPANTRLTPLRLAAKAAARGHPVTDPTAREATEFLRDQPVLESGAFCFVAVTGCEERPPPERPRHRRRHGDPRCTADELLPHACVSGILSLHGIAPPAGVDGAGSRHRRSRLIRGSSSRISITLPGQSF